MFFKWENHLHNKKALFQSSPLWSKNIGVWMDGIPLIFNDLINKYQNKYHEYLPYFNDLILFNCVDAGSKEHLTAKYYLFVTIHFKLHNIHCQRNLILSCLPKI